MTGSYSEVLVGTDGSSTANLAVRAAARLATALDVPLTIATSWHRDLPDPPVPSEEAKYPGGSASGTEAMWATTTASDAAGIAREAGATEVHQQTPEGSPAAALVELSDEREGCLVVVGTVGLGRRSERLVGNVPHQLSHHSHRDLLLIRSTDDHTRWGTVALATDGSETANRACGRGVAIADALDLDATLLTVARDQPSGDAILDAAAAALPDRDYGRKVAVGSHVADTLAEAASAYDLLVIGNKGMSGPSRLLGSIANRVTHAIPTDVLLVNTTR